MTRIRPYCRFCGVAASAEPYGGHACVVAQQVDSKMLQTLWFAGFAEACVVAAFGCNSIAAVVV